MDIKKLYGGLGILFFLLMSLFLLTKCGYKEDNIDIKVGVAAEEFPRVDSRKYEGKLRATALIIEGGGTRLCIVTCDVIDISRDFIDDVGRKIESELGIPFKNILISASHTHHGYSTSDSSFVKCDCCHFVQEGEYIYKCFRIFLW